MRHSLPNIHRGRVSLLSPNCFTFVSIITIVPTHSSNVLYGLISRDSGTKLAVVVQANPGNEGTKSRELNFNRIVTRSNSEGNKSQQLSSERLACLGIMGAQLTHFCPPLRPTFAVRETASLGIIGAPRVTPLNPSETIVL